MIKLTKRQEQAAQSRENLLKAAKRLFSEQGYAATSVRSINREVGLTDGILYHYFPGGKAEIFSVLMQEGVDELCNQLSCISDLIESMPLEEAVAQSFATVDFLLESDVQFLRLIFLENEHLGEADKAKFSGLIQMRVNWLSKFLEKRYQAGEVREMDFRIAAQQFMAANINSLNTKVLRIDLFGNMGDGDEGRRIVEYTLSQWKVPTPCPVPVV